LVLAAIHFATDQGILHPFFDRMTDGTFTAEDLRLRFEFGGAAGHTTLTPPSDLATPVRLSFGKLQVQLTVPFARFGNQSGQWDVSHGSDVANLDVVFYHGPKKKIRLADVQPAAIGLAVQFTVGQAPELAVRAEGAGDHLDLGCTARAGQALSLNVPTTPAPRDILGKTVRAAPAPRA
jgi:hypothetical protein